MSPRPNLTFPTVSHVRLRGFSLFSRQPNLDIDIPPGVFCLAGANGLGKSTFLAAINFGLTGFVPDPRTPYRSAEEYYQHHRYQTTYADKFFSGRITELDRDEASITLHLSVGGTIARITRGIFSPQGLRAFHVADSSEPQAETTDDDDVGIGLEDQYKRWLTEKVGLARFAQYAFLQHMVLTFDERRHLLLWDPRALNEALFLAIGPDPTRAAAAAELRRAMDKADSRARNRQFQINNVMSRLNTLQDEVPEPVDSTVDLEEFQTRHQMLEQRVLTQRDKLEDKWNERRDAELQRTNAMAHLSSLANQYTRVFSRHVGRRPRVDLHPIVAASISEDECAICAAPDVGDVLRAAIDNDECPLCCSTLPELAESETFADLVDVDNEMAQTKRELEAAEAAAVRLEREEVAATAALRSLQAELRDFEVDNRTMLLAASAGGLDRIGTAMVRLRQEREDLLAQKDEALAEREAKREELTVLQNELRQEYIRAESDFVPVLQRLGKAFLGIDLAVKAEVKHTLQKFGFTLELELRGATRTHEFQLSESQRFFLDIALRMALAEYMFTAGGGSALYIDTPEGSLDIAYEARAGQMFAEFVEGGHAMMMTANINTSQLLRRLAERTGRGRMTLHRMTAWTDLSEVQIAEEALFDTAYDEIETALGA